MKDVIAAAFLSLVLGVGVTAALMSEHASSGSNPSETIQNIASEGAGSRTPSPPAHRDEGSKARRHRHGATSSKRKHVNDRTHSVRPGQTVQVAGFRANGHDGYTLAAHNSEAPAPDAVGHTHSGSIGAVSPTGSHANPTTQPAKPGPTTEPTKPTDVNSGPSGHCDDGMSGDVDQPATADGTAKPSESDSTTHNSEPEAPTVHVTIYVTIYVVVDGTHNSDADRSNATDTNAPSTNMNPTDHKPMHDQSASGPAADVSSSESNGHSATDAGSSDGHGNGHGAVPANAGASSHPNT